MRTLILPPIAESYGFDFFTFSKLEGTKKPLSQAGSKGTRLFVHPKAHLQSDPNQ
ncbi:MAG: hypothetical protein VYC82_04420 [Verrucomicrobiota bacterium]|nr:hypothetical protein [Verrucomicrobiota bacterium]